MKQHILLIIISFLFAIASCKNSHVADIAVPGGDAASRFTIEQADGFKRIVVLNPWQGASDSKFSYYLFDDTTSVPDTLPLTNVVRVPVKRIVCMSTTHLAMVEALNATDAVVGISGRNLVYNKKIRDKLESGEVHDVGYESNLDKELIVSLKPDVLIVYGVDPASAGYLTKLTEMGITVMYDADYLEESPLARAEWIKVFGALLDKETQADSIYRNLRINYNRICDSVNTLSVQKPKVMFGGPWEDVWYVAPSNSYAIKLISDGGGDYIFNDVIAPSSQPYPVESVYLKSMNADVWLNPGSAKSLSELVSTDYRLNNLPVCGNKAVYNSNKRVTDEGANDYWESAVIKPDILLRDISAILHPELYPHYELVYYRRLK